MRTELERCEGEVRKLELKLEQARDLLVDFVEEESGTGERHDGAEVGHGERFHQPEWGHHERRDQDQTATPGGLFRQ